MIEDTVSPEKSAAGQGEQGDLEGHQRLRVGVTGVLDDAVDGGRAARRPGRVRDADDPRVADDVLPRAAAAETFDVSHG